MLETRESAESVSSRAFSWSRADWWIVACFSIFYVSDTFLRASGKYFWFDELFTVYLSRLNSFHLLWAALTTGIDFNPPPFYWLTRICMLVFGEGLISVRLPEIAGFWIFSICLYVFVRRRYGRLAALGAMLFPIVTQAYYYAYEARPHGVVLGFCGLALVCWQRTLEENRQRNKWIVGLGAALFGALMMHCYALTLVTPFALFEIQRFVRRRKADFPMWLALAIPCLLAMVLYVSLLRAFHQIAGSSDIRNLAAPGWPQVLFFYQFLLDPGLVVVGALLVIFGVGSAVSSHGSRGADSVSQRSRWDEIILVIAFLFVPVTGLLIAQAARAIYYDRYFLSAAIGIAIPIGIGASSRRRTDFVPAAAAILLVAAVLFNFGRVVERRLDGRGEALLEPSLKRPLETVAGKPLALDPLFASEHTQLPIAVFNPLDFVYLQNYAPAKKGRLYFVPQSSRSFELQALDRFRDRFGVHFNRPMAYGDFVKRFPHFLVYGDSGNSEELSLLSAPGVKIESLEAFRTHFLATLSR